MVLKTLGKLAATLLVGASLAGCIDATVDVEVTSETTAKATLTQVMGADFYAMVKMSAEESEAGSDEFCAEGVLSENDDGSATCTLTQEGPFAELTEISEGEDDVQFTSAGPGLVRVSLPTKGISDAVGAEDEMDAETRQMVEAFFAGHSLTVRVSGAEVVETNMTLSKDKKSAEEVVPFLDLISGTTDLPDELFAIVRAP